MGLGDREQWQADAESAHEAALRPILDSGKRRSFDTGSLRDVRDGKGRFDLLPMDALERMAKHFERGAEKYGDRNWEKGQPVMSFLDSAMRHLVKYMRGDLDEDHLTAAGWNILCAMQTEKWVAGGILPKHLDDVPQRRMYGAAPLHDEGDERGLNGK